MLFRIKEAMRNLIIWVFMAKKNDIQKGVQSNFSPEDYQTKHIANSSIIIMFQNQEHTLFFRECRRHQRMKAYLYECINDYFDTVCTHKDKAHLKAAVLRDLAKKENYKKTIHITDIFNRHLMKILGGVYCNYAATGFPCFAEFQDNEEFLSFIKYLSCAVISHRTNAYLKDSCFENFSANKQLATYGLSRLLGIEHMIPAVWLCRFSDCGKERVGTMMDKAEGIPPSDVLPAQRTNYIAKTFLKDLTNLEYFDALCYQLDHRLDNYYVTQNEHGAFEHVIAFDNDAVRTFFVSTHLPKKTYAEATGVLIGNRTINRPYMDKEFADNLLKLSRKNVKAAVGDCLSFFQLYCLNKRVRRLQKAVRKTAKQNKDFLVSDWETVHPQVMEDPKWGKTYFSLYLHDTLMLDREKEFEELKKAREG